MKSHSGECNVAFGSNAMINTGHENVVFGYHNTHIVIGLQDQINHLTKFLIKNKTFHQSFRLSDDLISLVEDGYIKETVDKKTEDYSVYSYETTKRDEELLTKLQILNEL